MSTTWQLGSKELDCSQPRVMAIVNATPDSFFQGSRLEHISPAARKSLAQLLDCKPDILDIGGQSSRPGSDRVSPEEEARRVVPMIRMIRELDADIPITVDTYYAVVAQAALSAGADGINDITAGRFDPGLWDVVAGSGCGYVLMHMQGTPETMQDSPHYDDCVAEVFAFLEEHLAQLERRHISRNRVVLDPGIGFGKRLEDNLALVKNAGRFCLMGRPVLYGVSRKSMIGQLTGDDGPVHRLPGTLGMTWMLLDQGVMLHRVHDAKEVRQLTTVWSGLHDR
jgi:dihydropteroate synthase